MYIQGANIIGGLKEVAFVGAQTQGAVVALNEIQKTAAENSKKLFRIRREVASLVELFFSKTGK